MAFDEAQLAAVAASLSVMAYLPYGWAVLRGRARPQRSSWLIWSVLSAVAFFAVLGSGGTRGLLFTGSQLAGTAAIFLLSLWSGAGSVFNRSEGAILSLSALGLLLWWATDDAAYAMALSIAIGTTGGSLTVLQAYRRPGSEALLPWAVQTLAAGFGVASALGGSMLELAYPAYLLALYAAIFGAGLAGRSIYGLPPGGAA